MWQAQVFTLYPEVFPGPLSKGLYGKALSNNLWKLKVVNIRDAADDKHKTVDDTPYGGGSGMLLKADVLAKSLDENKNESERILYLSPKGKKFDQNLAKELANEKSLSLICGHFEGVDERILSTRNIEEISIGDYVLSGGEIGAFVIIDAMVRLLPGELGNVLSTLDSAYNDLQFLSTKDQQDSFGRQLPSTYLISFAISEDIKDTLAESRLGYCNES